MLKNNNSLKPVLLSVISFLIYFCFTILSPYAYAGHLEPFKSVPVPKNNPQTPDKIELGKKLFFDRRLSGDGTMSCVTCHMPEHAFTDGQDISLSYPTTKNWRNSPTLINAAFQKNFSMTGGSNHLRTRPSSH